MLDVQVFRRAQSAFSLIEVLVVVGLLSFIILMLVAMFGQTQRAFRSSMTQTDLLESGRAIMDLLARDVEQIDPAYSSAVNFYAAIPPFSPLIQPLPGTTQNRTNFVEEFFFLTRENRRWTGVGYRVGTPPNLGVGTLYRYARSVDSFTDPAILYTDFANTPLTNLSRVAEGVVHLRVRAFDTTNMWIIRDLAANTDIRVSSLVADEIGLYVFTNSAVPAYVEVELGILESSTLERFRSVPAAAQREFLERQAGRVHVFRQRIPIRNVDPEAYR